MRTITANVVSPGCNVTTPASFSNSIHPRWQYRRDRHEVLLLDIRITQRQLKRRELLLVDADASREEEGRGIRGNIEYSLHTVEKLPVSGRARL